MTASDRPIMYAGGSIVDVDVYHPPFRRVFGGSSASSFDPCGGSLPFSEDAVAFEHIDRDETLAPASAHLNRMFLPDASPLDRQISQLAVLTSQKNWGTDQEEAIPLADWMRVKRFIEVLADERRRDFNRRIVPSGDGSIHIVWKGPDQCELRVEYFDGRFADSVTRGESTTYRDDLTAHEAAERVRRFLAGAL